MTEQEKLLDRAEELLGAVGRLRMKVYCVQIIHPVPEYGLAAPLAIAPLDVIVTFDGDLPAVEEVVAIGRAAIETYQHCRAVYTHSESGVLVHQVDETFIFAGSALIGMPVVVTPSNRMGVEATA